MTKKLTDFPLNESSDNNLNREDNSPLNMDEYAAFQEGLQFGDRVLAKWTNSGRFYQVEPQIVKVNIRSFRVVLYSRIEFN